MALIPPQYLNAIVSIEVDSKDQKGSPVKRSIATGFILGTLRGDKDEKGNKFYNLSLVTNRHVYEDLGSGTFLKEVYWRFNTTDGRSHYYKVDLLKSDGKPLWFKHKDDRADIAVMPLNGGILQQDKIDFYFFREDSDLFLAKDFEKSNISTGDGLFVLGFPMSIAGKTRNFVIARQGIVARADSEILENHFYYIDASAYPGNSGGPVIHKPEVVSIGGTESNNSAGLMGIISSGETFSDVAVSQQTKEPRIIFTEQTGLVRVVPIESVLEAISDFITKKDVEKAEPEKISEEGTTETGQKNIK